MICAHGIHMDNACGACEPPRGTTIRAHSKSEYRRRVAQGDPNIQPPAPKHGVRVDAPSLTDVEILDIAQDFRVVERPTSYEPYETFDYVGFARAILARTAGVDVPGEGKTE